MKFFPHNLGNTLAYQATSASIAGTAQYLNNFAGIPVSTANIALNIKGATGASGNSYGPYTGATGPRGATGATGAKGLGIYVLANSRGTCGSGGATCHTLTSIGYTSDIFAPFYCVGGSNTYSTNNTTGVITNGNILYADTGCATVFNNSGNLTDGTTVFSTDSSGVITIQGTCSN
jgi:hypothetical protein